jgi:L-lactate dehydrogenase complex protein LldE
LYYNYEMSKTVQLMVTCLVDTFFPEVGEAILKVLQRAGVEVKFPTEQTCCGQPAFNAGLRAEARPLAEHTIRVFESTPGAVIIPSGSCAVMLKQGYLELFADDPPWLERARTLAFRTFEFSEYLVDHLGLSDLGAEWPGKLTYHTSCHLLRGLGVDRQPRLLLSHVHKATVIDLPHSDECCGFGGVFSVKHPELSAEMLKRKILNLESTDAPTLVVSDTGCLMNIQGGLKRLKKPQQVLHLAQVLANRE